MRADRIRLAKAHHPVTSLGWGRRVGIWLQGCSIGCPGCLSRDTWSTDSANEVDLDVVVDWVADRLVDADGLSISGGEPTEQLHAVAALVTVVRALDHDGRLRDVLVYTGRNWDELQSEVGTSLVGVDAIISEPFEARLAADDGWRGSTNQVHHALTQLGRERHPGSWAAERRLQIEVDDGGIWMVGIPRHGDLSRLEADLREDGVILGDVSWRP